MTKYNFSKVEKKWQQVWQKEKTYEPSLKSARRPFYNLMMFPYPSAEGLHVGNMYAFTGADIYGRFRRMQGYDVFEPIGLDGFGIHSENYALKIGTHPAKQAKISEKRFYKQLASIGNGFAWNEHLETYDPEYYKWTQWIFAEMFKKGLAYRKKQAVNWCPSCKTVLADEQVVAGKCERCGTVVAKKDLEQWFFRITKYADRLLGDLKNLDWSERVKIAQENWIGKSEGAEIKFEIKNSGSGIKRFILLHGKGGHLDRNFFRWLKGELEKQGYEVEVPILPGAGAPNDDEQADYVIKNCKLDEQTAVLGHSFGGIVALRILERGFKLGKVILVATPSSGVFLDKKERLTVTAAAKKGFNFDVAKKNCPIFDVLIDTGDSVVPPSDGEFLAKELGVSLNKTLATEPHFDARVEPGILNLLPPFIRVFTTRPDTLFGATYLVFSPENEQISNLRSQIKNWSEVENYIEKAKSKSNEERISEGKDKSGIELKGVKAINPANDEEIPIWVADYVLADVGTGAIIAVPAHDERDFDFAKKFKLPMRMVICPHYPAKTCPVLDEAYVGKGHMVDSGKFDGMDSEKAKWEIAKFAGGERKVQYRLRDWLISRQRYWGPPIPLVFCENCAEQIANRKSQIVGAKLNQGEIENPGWVAVPEDELPVKLPVIKDFKPLGMGKSPLATDPKFYKTKCPRCGGPATRETDVSDTFLDSAWYYLRYLDPKNKKQPFDKQRVRKWLPINLYTGGAEHSVLHLLYVRFLAKVFHDWKLVDFDEPAKKFRAHGLLIKEGSKMSKSKGNIVNPDFYIKKFGADTLRMYLMFLAPFEQGGDFRDSGILGLERFLQRVWRLMTDEKLNFTDNGWKTRELIMNRAVEKATKDIENLHFNTAISQLMITLRVLEEYPDKNSFGVFLKLLAPFAPHMTEEIWREILGNEKSIHLSDWPKHDPRMIQGGKFTLVVQINGKVRDNLEVDANIKEKEAIDLALKSEKVLKFTRGKKVKRVIFVPGRLINFVI